MENAGAKVREEAKKEKRIKKKTGGRRNLFARFWPLYLMLLPLIVYLFIFNYYPMFGLQIAFKDWYVRKGIWGSPWATTDGKLDLFKHFSQLFGTSLFKEKLVNTLRISLLKMLFGFPAPIILVLALNELPSARFAKFTQSVSYIPHFLSWVVLGGIFLSLDKSAAFQGIMLKLFGKNVHFFSDDNLYIGFLIFSDIYKEVGWGTIIYLATLMNIDPQLYEAASLDGAGRFKKIVYITLPGLCFPRFRSTRFLRFPILCTRDSIRFIIRITACFRARAKRLKCISFLSASGAATIRFQRRSAYSIS